MTTGNTDLGSHIIDVGSILAIASGLLGWLPTIVATVAALLAGLWYGIQIYDRLKHGFPRTNIISTTTTTKETKND